MKNIPAILLLLVFLFNVAGYRLLFYYADRQADHSFTTMIDRGEYSSSALITVAVPLNMPYIADQQTERTEGEITINGQVYRYVSRAVRNDSLILKCLPDHSKTAIAEARIHLGIQLSDNQVPEKKLPGAARKFVTDNDYDLHPAGKSFSALASTVPSLFSSFTEAVVCGSSFSLFQPPRPSAGLA